MGIFDWVLLTNTLLVCLFYVCFFAKELDANTTLPLPVLQKGVFMPTLTQILECTNMARLQMREEKDQAT